MVVCASAPRLMIIKKAREMGFMVPTISWGQYSADEYEGATVLDAQKGAYYTPITALDFEGLYNERDYRPTE